MAHFHLHHQPAAHADEPPATPGRTIRWARYYDPFVSILTLGHRQQLRRATVALAHIQPGARVLEVGCGTGDVALVASRQVGPSGAVSGIDAAPEMIEVARAKAAQLGLTVDFQTGLIEALAFPAASFDVVLSSLMMHHLPNDLKRQGLAEIARVLKPGGHLLIVDIKRPARRLERMVNHIVFHGGMTIGVQDFGPLLREAGFTAVETGDTGFPLLGFVRGQTQD
jgi:ubiquinone/menaquinone biosynthesis C-methylase UbiE